MSVGPVEENRLRIERFHALYLVPADAPSPISIRARLDQTATRELAETLAGVLSAQLSHADPSVWIIRQLNVDVDLSIPRSLDRMARVWAVEIADRLHAVLQTGGDGYDSIRFEDRAAYLAAFLVDVASGSVGGKWYYEPFAGLRLLPTSAALRTAMCDQGALALTALLRLPATDLSGVMRMLTSQDSSAVLDRLMGDATTDEMDCFRALRSVWIARSGAAPLASTWRNVLHLYVDTCRVDLEVSGRTLRAAVDALWRLDSLLTSLSTERGDHLVAALIHGDSDTLVDLSSANDAQALMPLSRCPPDWLDELAHALRTSAARREPCSTVEAPQYTAFGGVFLLLPLLDAAPFERATRGWADAGGTAALSLARFLTFITCCGRERAEDAFVDPLVRDLFGIGPGLSTSDVLVWQENVDRPGLDLFVNVFSEWHAMSGTKREGNSVDDSTYLDLPAPLFGTDPMNRALTVAATVVMRHFARKLPGYASSSLTYIYDNFLDMSARLDRESGRTVVRLSRPPLAIMLGITGMARQTYRVSWLEGPGFALFPEE